MKRRFNQRLGEGFDTARRWSLRVALGVIHLLQTEEGMQAEGKTYAIAKPGYQFEFPRDYGSHPDFKIEWWYITGHLKSEEDRRFGYQATFFRLAADSAISREGNPPLPQDIHLAHMALLDCETKKFYHQERLQQSPWMASAKQGDMELKNGNWKLRRMTESETPEFELSGSILADVSLHMQLSTRKPITLFGNEGYSQKGSVPSAASYYMTFTRLQTTGSIRLNGKSLKVRGWSWMDHEVSSSQLAPQQVGWDWISIRLKDGRDIMAYRMRTTTKEADPFSTFAWVDADGNASHQRLQDDMWKIKRLWTSPETKNTYPVEVELVIPDPDNEQPFLAHIVPLYDGQEILGHISSIEYWEGACDVLDSKGNTIGEAYMELAGYGGESDLSALKR